MTRRGLRWTCGFLGALVVAMLIVAAYSGGGGIWVTRAADFVASNFPGTSGGATSADAFIPTTGIGQIGPGLEAITPPTYRAGVGWVWQRYDGWQYRGLPFISAHRNLATFRADSAGVWIAMTGTGGRGYFYGTAGRWKFAGNGSDLTDSSSTMTVKNESASGTMVVGGGNAASITMTNASTSFAGGRNVSFLQNIYTPNYGTIATSSGTLNLQISGLIYNINILTNPSVIDSVAANFPDGMRVTLLTDVGLTLKDGKNLVLDGDFTGDGVNGSDVIILISNSSKLIEEHRSFN